MADYITLLGSEQVQKAGYAMQDAASAMQRAADMQADALVRHQRFMEDWIIRFEAAVERIEKASSKGGE